MAMNIRLKALDVRGFAVFLAFLFQTALGLSQDNPLQRRISVQLREVTIQEALKVIAAKGAFLYAYNASTVNLNEKKSLRAEQKTVSYCLQQVLGDDVQLRSGGNHIIIIPNKNKRSEPGHQKYVLEGTITDKLSGKAVKYASVYEAGQLKSALSDQTGRYRIELDREPEYVHLLISRKSYRDTVIVIKPKGDTPFNIRIRPATIDELQRIEPEIPSNLATNGLFQAVVSEEQVFHTENRIFFEERSIQVGFLPTLGSNRQFGGVIQNHFSLNVLGGYSMGLNGAEIAGLFNITRRNVSGFQLAGFMNITGGATKGIQFAGFMNNNIGRVDGAQWAGFYNLSLDTLRGIQTAGFFNLARGQVKGLQIAGFSNFSGKSLRGIQMSGFLNWSGKKASGVQVAGFTNITSGDFQGVQCAGFLNLSAGDMSGVQLSGAVNVVADSSQTLQIAALANFAHTLRGSQISSLLNIAGTVSGSQVGLINVSDTVSGFTFGLLSLVRRGYHKLELSTGDVNPLMVRFRTGTYGLYNIVSAGLFQLNNAQFSSFGYGLGTELRARKKFFFGIDLELATVFQGQFLPNVFPDLWAKSNLYLGWRPVRGIQLFAGPCIHTYRIDQNNLNGKRPGVHRSDLFSEIRPDAQFFGWLGWQAGIRFF